MSSYKRSRTSRFDQRRSGNHQQRSRFGGSRHGSSGYGGRSRGRQEKQFNIGNGQPGANLRPVDFSGSNLQPFQKCFMQGMKGLQPQEIEAWRSANEVTVEGQDCPAPLRNYAECPFPQSFLARFAMMGFQAPTPCQSQGWPMALTGRDIVVVAETGSGKTLGFIIPALIHIQYQQPLQTGEGPIALVVAPTRELACQIEKEAQRFGSELGISMCCVYGGAPKRNQQYALQRGCHLVICTPGRMLDFLENRVVNLRRTTFVVFDEADRMLDMGFEPQIRALLGQIRPDRQMQMWSATWPKEVRRMASDLLPNNKILMKIGTDDGTANKRVTQKILIVKEYEKMDNLNQTLHQFSGQKVLIFTGTKRMANDLAYKLRGQRMRCSAIHGDKKQFDRERTLSDFKSGSIDIMVATDVASRGIHVNDIGLVINYDFPQCLEDYIHRIGRTGRAGAFGTAVTFFDMSKDGKKARGLANILREANQEVPPQLLSGGFQRNGRQGRNRYRAY